MWHLQQLVSVLVPKRLPFLPVSGGQSGMDVGQLLLGLMQRLLRHGLTNGHLAVVKLHNTPIYGH